jgi:hypothetical protein
MADKWNRIRKVKCDEGRPSCQKCVSTSRTCDGYGIWGGGDRSLYQTESGLGPLKATATSNPKVPIYRNKARLQSRNEAGAEVRLLAPRVTERSFPGNTANNDCVDMAVIATHTRDVPELISPVMRRYMPTSIPASFVPSPGNLRERELLSWYQGYTADKLPGLFPSDFWRLLLPRASYSEPAVMHAVVALTSAHRHVQADNTVGRLLADEPFTLQAYSKAISYLRPHFGPNNNPSLRVTLITCILFVCLEIVQQHHVTAVSHLSNGLELIKQYEQCRSTIRTKAFVNHHPSDNLVAHMFLKLSLQVNMLGYSHSHPVLVSSGLITDNLPRRFNSTTEARQHLDKMIARAFELSDLCRKQEPLQQNQRVLLDQQTTLQADLVAWLQTLTSSDLDTDPTVSPLHKAACIVLRMYNFMAKSIVESCVFADQETLFDHQWGYFLSIIACAIHAKKLIEASQTDALPGVPVGTHGIIIDIGWIPALYYTAIKCRIRRIRLHAIRFLASTTHREGFWDAKVAAQVAGEVMRMEEEEQETCIDDDFSLDSIPTQEELQFPLVSELQRVHDVEVVLPDEPWTRVRFRCRRRRTDGSWEDIWKEHDPVAGSWLNMAH